MRYGLRQRDVAALVNATDYEIRKWERGLAVPPSSAITALAALYGVEPSVLRQAQMTFMEDVAPGEGYTTARARSSGIRQPSTDPPSGRLRVLDLFCGAGGLSFGLELTDRFATVAGLDLLPDRITTFRANHPHATGVVGDIRDVSVSALVDIANGVDVVVGGPPCQGFSSIRPFRNLTEGDERNTLIEQFMLWVAAIKPRWFVFENVVGLLTHRGGTVLKTLIDGFESYGYTVTWRVVNSALYGVPQNRERLIVVGNRSGIRFSWPQPTHRSNYKSMARTSAKVVRNDPRLTYHLPTAVTVMESIGDLPEVGAGRSSTRYGGPPENDFQAWARGDSSVLTMHNATKHSPRMLEIIKFSGANISAIPKHLISSGFSSSYSRLSASEPSTTLTVNFVHPASNRCIHPLQDRALTPREGARIQSFPDSFQFHGTRAQVVKQIGNAVPPLLAMSIGDSIARADGLS